MSSSIGTLNSMRASAVDAWSTRIIDMLASKFLGNRTLRRVHKRKSSTRALDVLFRARRQKIDSFRKIHKIFDLAMFNEWCEEFSASFTINIWRAARHYTYAFRCRILWKKRTEEDAIKRVLQHTFLHHLFVCNMLAAWRSYISEMNKTKLILLFPLNLLTKMWNSPAWRLRFKKEKGWELFCKLKKYVAQL